MLHGNPQPIKVIKGWVYNCYDLEHALENTVVGYNIPPENHTLNADVSFCRY